jgi:hypothetical protein
MSGVLNVRLDRLVSRRQGALARLTKQLGVYAYDLGQAQGAEDKEKVLKLTKKIERGQAEQKILQARTDANYVKPQIYSGKARKERTESKAQGRSY